MSSLYELVHTPVALALETQAPDRWEQSETFLRKSLWPGPFLYIQASLPQLYFLNCWKMSRHRRCCATWGGRVTEGGQLAALVDAHPGSVRGLAWQIKCLGGHLAGFFLWCI